MEELDKNILKASLEYLYWFSRFEYTLKENGHIKSNKIGDPAKANWESFRNKYIEHYNLSDNAKELIKLHPKQQIIGSYFCLMGCTSISFIHPKQQIIGLNKNVNHWKKAEISHCAKSLCKVIVMLNTVRNNLFHGGKHYSKSKEEKENDLRLIELSIQVVKEIAYIEDFGMETFEPYQNFDLKEIVFN